MQLNGNTVLITGGSSGLGYAIARALAGAENHVIITGRHRAKLESIRAQYSQIEIVEADMLDVAMPQQLAETYAHVNIVINNAGVQFNHTLADINICPEQLTTEIGTDFTGQVLLIQAFLPKLMSHSSAAIINITSTLGIVPKQNAAVYCATKAAMHSLTQTLRWQLEGSTVKVFEVLPPLMNTPMTAGRTVAKVFPEQVAQAVLNGFAHDQLEMWIGKTKALRMIHRLSPAFAQRLMRHR